MKESCWSAVGQRQKGYAVTAQITEIADTPGNTPLSGDDILHKLLQSLSPQQQISVLQTLDSNVLLTALQQKLKGSETAHPQIASEVASDNKRRATRRRVLLGAKIIYNGRLGVLSCHVRDISETGCRLKVSATSALPKRFTLEIAEGGISKECEVAWRKEDSMGVRFLT